MAWCPHCVQDRPIQRQTFTGFCSYCKSVDKAAHKPGCRGPVSGALDVCTYCNTPVFAKALDRDSFERAEAAEAPLRNAPAGCATVLFIVGSSTLAAVTLLLT